tara:strand:+ start:32504 stop:33973 length:1470 start_codon:yes stop_codon:yes gene_type:complete
MSRSDGEAPRFAIIGAGISGILCAIKLLEAGHRNIIVYEKGDGVGGTWHRNTYPGLFCDVPSHTYCYSFEPNPEWSQVFSPGREILSYLEHTVAKYGVDQFIRYSEEVTACEYTGNQWRLTTKLESSDLADFIICATGVLHHPHYPKIPGLEKFEGHIIHSARWDHEVQLENKRIAVVGNGSTGVQLVAELASNSKHLVHYQRTPQWIRPIENPHFSEEQKRQFRLHPELLQEMRRDPAFYQTVNDFSTAITDPESDVAWGLQEFLAQNLEASVSNPLLKEKLLPDHRAGCKRIVSSPNYYQQIQRDNVDTVTCGIREIDARGVRDNDGGYHRFDIIALATGYNTLQFMRPMRVIGHNGVDLNERWAKRPAAYLATSVPDFPNFFMMSGPNGPIGNASLIDVSEMQWEYISQLIDVVLDKNLKGICVSNSAFEDFEERRIKAAKTTLFATGCDSWYLDDEGVPATWPWSMEHFEVMMKAPILDDYDHFR